MISKKMFSGKRIKLKYLFQGENLCVLWQSEFVMHSLFYTKKFAFTEFQL